MIISINYDKKEIKLNFDASRTNNLPSNWGKYDLIKTGGEDDYNRLKTTFKILN